VKKLMMILMVLVLALPALALAKSDVDEILLKDGNVVTGRIVSETDDEIVLETESLGRITLERARIERITRAGEKRAGLIDPDHNSILLTPTPETLPKGSHYFRSYELLILHYGYGITDDLNFSAAAMFPITTEWNFIYPGLKWRILDRAEQGFGLAVTGGYLIAPYDQTLTTFGVVAGVGNERRCLNFALDYAMNQDGDGGERIFLGGDMQISRRIKLFAEWGTMAKLLSNDEDDAFNGLLNFGFRVFGEHMAFSLGVLRPLIDSDDSSFVGIPMMMFSAHW